MVAETSKASKDQQSESATGGNNTSTAFVVGVTKQSNEKPSSEKPILGLLEWYAVHQKEKSFDMRSRTVAWKHLLQSTYCKLSGSKTFLNAKTCKEGRIRHI